MRTSFSQAEPRASPGRRCALGGKSRTGHVATSEWSVAKNLREKSWATQELGLGRATHFHAHFLGLWSLDRKAPNRENCKSVKNDLLKKFRIPSAARFPGVPGLVRGCKSVTNQGPDRQRLHEYHVRISFSSTRAVRSSRRRGKASVKPLRSPVLGLGRPAPSRALASRGDAAGRSLSAGVGCCALAVPSLARACGCCGCVGGRCGCGGGCDGGGGREGGGVGLGDGGTFFGARRPD